MPLWSSAFYWLGWVIRLVMLPIVVRRKRRAEVALAWLSIIFLAPLPGLIGYLLFGEVRLGARRVRRHAREVDVIERAHQAGVNVRHTPFSTSPLNWAASPSSAATGPS